MGAPSNPLLEYQAKREFGKTPEPAGEARASGDTLAFVIQKHAASRLHYDFRLELDGVMLSWAVPKGPSYDPKDKRMAVRVEDHPISYNDFEGTIPRGQYGAGTVIVWDRGTWVPAGDPRQGLADGKLVFALHGHKMHGTWELVRIGKPGERQIPWLLFKKRDAYARPKAEYDVVTALPDGVSARPEPAAPPKPQTAATAAAGARRGRRRSAHGGGDVDHAADLSGAVPAALPARLGPQLATLASGLPASGDWRFEIKFDGYRLLARIDEHGVRLHTRGGHDWASKMPALAGEIGALGLHASWLDGEVVVLGDHGTPDFNALQRAFDRRTVQDLVYFVFDIPFFEGQDLRRVPLHERRNLLRRWMETRTTTMLRYSADFEADPATLLESARQMGLEGLIAKRSDAPYVSARTETWLKLKCRQRQEFVVAGFTDRGGDTAASEIGSLLLGVYGSARQLVSVGRVGTGWSAATAADLRKRLAKLETAEMPFAAPPVRPGRGSKAAAGSARWVKPSLVAEVSFSDWTPDGQLRHATFEGLRADKPAREVKREVAAKVAGAMPLRSAAATKVTHGERVIDASTGLTKLDLVRYYESVGAWLLPHLKGRPCSLVRGPNGVGGELFFQKHAETLQIAGVRELDPRLSPEHEALLEVPTVDAIAGAAQMNVIEFHTWNARSAKIEHPDRIVFDLDPGEGVAWPLVQDAAKLTRSFLDDLGLQSWLKTSGGKGLHVVVPITPRYDWATVSGFSQAVVQHLARVVPSRFVARSGPANRVGRIFVDHLRNRRGATTVAAYSARARPGLGVSMPLAWDGLDGLKSAAQWTIANAREHLSFQTEDPWAAYWTCRQPLTAAIKRLQAASNG